ncbi:MAG TPA: CHRD domain-containing protein [Blastocatellia bacterium]|nr:CHRD domain-containing protein [Blastocatellia bacterium]
MKRSVASTLLILLFIVSAAAMLMPRAQAQTETRVFVASLSAGQEVAPVVVHPTETGTVGSAIVTIEVTRSGGVITAASTRFDASLSGMAGNSVIILAHVHEGAAGVNGPIRIDSNISPAAPVPTAGGAASFIRTGLATPPAVAQAIIDNPGGWYFNVHTALSPGGVARGQLVAQQTGGGGPALGAPTLSEWGLILMTLLFIAACSFFIVGRSRAASLLAASGHADEVPGPAKVIDWKLLITVTLYTEAAIALALVVLGAGSVDILGALASGLIVAFTLHLFIGAARRR